MRSAAHHVVAISLPVVFAGLCGAAIAQTGAIGLPSSQVTGVEVPVRNGSAAPSSGRQTEVRYVDGLLTVTARDASLNAILREISKQTGMTVTGGVRDDRVFGTYGPDHPSAVLSTLLDGSGSNMLFVNSAANQPAHLILSPRTGGATPPSQFAAERQQQEQNTDESTQAPMPFGARQAPPAGIRVGDAPANQPMPQAGAELNPAINTPTTNNSDSQAVVFPPVNATTTPATATTSSDVTQDAPNGVKTPQQIFEQLQRLRQQQEQTQQDGTQP